MMLMLIGLFALALGDAGNPPDGDDLAVSSATVEALPSAQESTVAAGFELLNPPSPDDPPVTAGQIIPEKKQEPPTPEHTGFATLFRDTIADFKAFPRRPS